MRRRSILAAGVTAVIAVVPAAAASADSAHSRDVGCGGTVILWPSTVMPRTARARPTRQSSRRRQPCSSIRSTDPDFISVVQFGDPHSGKQYCTTRAAWLSRASTGDTTIRSSGSARSCWASNSVRRHGLHVEIGLVACGLALVPAETEEVWMAALGRVKDMRRQH
jgi:hypothetical protein